MVRTVDGEWLLQGPSATMMSCDGIEPDLEALWDQARDLSKDADMSDMESALASMDIAMVQRVDQEAKQLGERMAERSHTWRYFLECENEAAVMPDIKDTSFYQHKMQMRIEKIREDRT